MRMRGFGWMVMYLKNLYIIATDRVDKMERDVYAMIGGQINLNSPVQVAQALRGWELILVSVLLRVLCQLVLKYWQIYLRSM